MHPIILASKHLKIEILKGKVITPKLSPIANIQIGFGYIGIIDKKYKIALWENTGTIEFKGNAWIGVGSKIVCHKGKLEFGNNFCLNGNSDIICRNNIIFGENSLVSWECLIMDTDFHHIYSKNEGKIPQNIDQPIFIGNHVWIGCRSTILKGTTISDDCVISACSKVRDKLITTNAVYIDNKLVKTDIIWEK